MNSDCLREPRTRVNGKFLSQYVGKGITIVGNVLKVNPNGSSLEMKSTDNQLVTINFSSPLQELVDGWVEIRGIAQGKNSVKAQHYLPLSSELMTNFDADLFDDIVTIINTCNNPWINSDGT